jgi:hypothetical protein
MVQGIIIWLVTLLLSYPIIGALQQRYPRLDRSLMVVLFFYHSLLALAYYGYVLFNPSDSKNYFTRALMMVKGENWFDYYGVSTAFIEFISFFLVNYLGFNYEASMAFFSWLGFWDFYTSIFFSASESKHRQSFLVSMAFGCCFYSRIFISGRLHWVRVR